MTIVSGLSRVLVLLSLVALSMTASVARAADVALIPQPQSIERGEGAFTIDANTRIVVPAGDSGAAAAAAVLRERLERGAGLKLDVAQRDAGAPANAGERAIVFSTLRDPPAPAGVVGAYTLAVRPEGVEIGGHDGAGLFYGVQTLLQLLPPQVYGDAPAANVAWSAPAVTVRDQPRFEWRGAMLDVCRHMFKKQEIYRLLDALAMQKQNVFHWHLTDDQGWRIEIKKYPRLTEVGAWRPGIGFGIDPKASDTYDAQGRYGGFFTQDDVRDVVAYAAARHITVVPEIEMPGHAKAALSSYPQLSCTGLPIEIPLGGGVHEDVFCAGNDETYAFLQDVLAEVIPLFPSKLIHVGGDECPKVRWKACPKCQARMRAEGLKDEHELQSYFVQRMEKFLNAHGKQLIGWDEILEGGLAPNATVMSWRGVKGGIAAAQSGHDTVMTPTTHCYLDYLQARNGVGEPRGIGGFLPLEKVYEYEPIPAELTPEQAKHVKGVQGNLWTEFIANFDHATYMYFPRLSAIAEIGWSPQGKRDLADFRRRMEQHQRRLAAMGLSYRPEPPEGLEKAITLSDDGKRLTIASPLPDAVVRYTLDGSDPTPQSPRYERPIDVPGDGAIDVRVRFYTPESPRGFYVGQSLLDGRPFDVGTNLRTYEGNGPMRAFDGRDDTFFWGDRAVRAGDHVTVTFPTPRPLRSLRVVTGKPDGKDALAAGELQVSRDGSDFAAVATFRDGSAEATLDGTPVRAVRLRATAPSPSWLAVREFTIR